MISTNKHLPLVSVVIPYYNRERFLLEALESVAGQQYTNWEIVAVDDGSDDAGREIAGRFAAKYPTQVKLLSHPEDSHQGAGPSRNLGIQNASGKYVAFLDSDDVFFEDTLAREIDAMNNNPGADGVCGTVECWYSWDAKSNLERDFVVDLMLSAGNLYDPPELLLHSLESGGRKPGITAVLLRKEFVDRIGAFESDFKNIGEDQVFWAKVALNGRIYVLDACLAKYRQHDDSTCAVKMRSGEDIPLMNLFIEWLDEYLLKTGLDSPNLMEAVAKLRRRTRWENKLRLVKVVYRKIVPLYLRYWVRGVLSKSSR